MYDAKRTALGAGAGVLLLVIAHVTIILALSYGYGGRPLSDRWWLFDLNAERNVPTAFSTALFVVDAWLLLQVWRQRQARFASHLWLLLAVVFLFLAVDEMFNIHERLIAPMRAWLHASGPFYYAWIVPYSVLTIALAIAFVPVWRRLPPAVRMWLALSAVTYVGGAIGWEMISGAYFEVSQVEDLTFSLMAMVEESMEMAGLILLMYGLMTLLEPRRRSG
jgi:hypothetical protein